MTKARATVQRNGIHTVEAVDAVDAVGGCWMLLNAGPQLPCGVCNDSTNGEIINNPKCSACVGKDVCLAGWFLMETSIWLESLSVNLEMCSHSQNDERCSKYGIPRQTKTFRCICDAS